MKTLQSLMIIFLFAFGLGGPTICRSQVVAIGHVTAEVIESVSASTQAVTNFSLGTNSTNSTLTAGQALTASQTMNLGAMTINSGNNVSVNVVLKSASLSNSQGNGFTLDPAIANNAFASTASLTGSQNIQLNGTANLASNQASGNYEGSYTVVFAYN